MLNIIIVSERIDSVTFPSHDILMKSTEDVKWRELKNERKFKHSIMP